MHIEDFRNASPKRCKSKPFEKISNHFKQKNQAVYEIFHKPLEYHVF